MRGKLARSLREAMVSDRVSRCEGGGESMLGDTSSAHLQVLIVYSFLLPFVLCLPLHRIQGWASRDGQSIEAERSRGFHARTHA